MLASLVEVLWQMKRVDEAAMLLGRQLELQSQQEDIDPIVLAQGYAALGALRWEASDHEAALATYLLAERHYELALDEAAAASAGAKPRRCMPVSSLSQTLTGPVRRQRSR